MMDFSLLLGKRCWPVSLVAIWVVVVSLGGCNSRPSTYAVTGTVTYQGKPVEDAGVQFMPKRMRPAGARTDKEGHFRLTTFLNADGAAAGEHLVCITKLIPAPSTKDEPYKQAINVLPARYGNPLKSPLKANVTTSGPNDFHFDLTD